MESLVGPVQFSPCGTPAGKSQVRSLVMVPLPQLTVQDDQPAQTVHVPSTDTENYNTFIIYVVLEYIHAF